MPVGPDRMTVARGSGCRRAFFGLPFLVFGLASLTCPLWGSFFGKEIDASPFLMMLALAFTFAGVWHTFRCSGVVIDRKSRTIIVWRSLFVPYSRMKSSLDRVEAVSLARTEIQSSRSVGSVVYPVRLVARHGHIDIDAPDHYAAARRLAENVAEFIGVRLEDTTTGKKVVREAGKLDEPLGEKLKKAGSDLAIPEPPPGAKAKVIVTEEGVTFEIPPVGFGPTALIIVAFGVAGVASVVLGAGMIYRDFTTGTDAGRYVVLAVATPVLLLWLAFSVWLALGGLRVGTAQELVTVSPHGLRQEMRSPFGTAKREIGAAELEEIQAGRGEEDRSPWSGKELVARSDRLTVQIGQGLERCELEWMKRVMEAVLAARR